MKTLKITKEQKDAILRRLRANSISILDCDDEAYNLGLDDIVKEGSRKWWNHNHGFRAILPFEFIDTLKSNE